MKRSGILTVLMAVILVFSVGAQGKISGKFDWKRFSGAELRFLGVSGPYNPEIQEAFASFKDLTGIDVKADFLPESDYYTKVQLIAAAGTGEYDMYMVGYPNLIDWVPAKWLEPLDQYLNNSALTSPDMNFADFYPRLVENCYWDGINGHKFGKTASAKLYALPLGTMINTIMYRKDIFDKHGLKPPKTVKEAIQVGKTIQAKEPGMYGLALRGKKEVATLYGGIWQTLKSYGADDFDAKLNPQFNQKAMIDGLTEVSTMIKEIGNINNWANMTWYEVMTDLASGKCAMALDAVPMIAWINGGDKSVAQGKLAYAPPIYGKSKEQMVSSLWSWNLSVASSSKAKEASWLFIQYVTGQKMEAEGSVMAFPVRKSVFEAPSFVAANKVNEGFFDTWNATIPSSGFIFTPAIGLNDYGYAFVGEIQNAVLGNKTPKNAMDSMNKYYKDNF